jgi:hypothetical protein
MYMIRIYASASEHTAKRHYSFSSHVIFFMSSDFICGQLVVDVSYHSLHVMDLSVGRMGRAHGEKGWDDICGRDAKVLHGMIWFGILDGSLCSA